MISVGITGQSGFIGTHLYNSLGLFPADFERVPFEDSFFQDELELRAFVKHCNVIVHLAAMNRNSDPKIIHDTNLDLVQKLKSAMEAEGVNPHVLFSSSSQESLNNEYGRSKRAGRELLTKWAEVNMASFTGMVIPNVFGPFGLPNYNSFIATFCFKLTHDETPKIIVNGTVKLIYVGSLCSYIINKIKEVGLIKNHIKEFDIVAHDIEMSVREILSMLQEFKYLYFEKGFIPKLHGQNEINLFNTFRSYIDQAKHFPVKLVQHTDQRGVFVETIKVGVGGQVSFSRTFQGVTRGNHFHTRKIERFIVINGKARIQLRRIGTNDILDFYLNGSEPSYVDMPIWYTHNITNIGNEELFTQFWINEWFNPEDGDTFSEKV